MNDQRRKHSRRHGVIQRFEQFGCVSHPAAHRAPRQLQAEPRHFVFESIKRHVLGIFADDQMRQQPRAGQALGDRLGRCFGDRDVLFAVLAGVLVSNVNEHFELRRFELELLALFAADSLARLSATRTGFLGVGQVVLDLLARQIFGKLPSSAVASRVFLDDDSGFFRRSLAGSLFRLRLSREQGQLAGIDLLAAWAEAIAEQPIEIRLQLSVVSLESLDRLELLSHQRLERRHVFGE